VTDRIIRGVGVSPGVAIAPAITVRWAFPEVPDRTVAPSELEHEIHRLHAAVDAVILELQTLRDRTHQRTGLEEAGIFDAQIMMARDPDVLAGIEALIRKNHLAAETAYEFKALELRNTWQGARSSMMRDRVADLAAIQLRTIGHLLGTGSEEAWLSEITEQVVLVAHELSPGLTVQFDRDLVVGLISEEGTRTSHAAILAHSLGIPAVIDRKSVV
jgi:phosphotransferase system enzyme I (PtsI)